MSVVSIVRVENERVDEAVRRGVDLAGGLESLVRPGSTILIKPNVVSPSPSGSGKITDARVTAAVTRMVLELGPERVVIGEGSSVGYDFPGRLDTLHCLEVSGTAQVARELGVEIVDLNRDERVKLQVDEAFVMHSFAVARTAWEADLIISLPVVKTHVRTGITCGLKNMKGVLPGDEKKRSHRVGLDRAIVDLNRMMRPAFAVVDAIVGVEGTHAYPEDRVPLGKIVSGADVVAVDAVCAAVIGFPADQILHVRLAAEAGLGTSDMARIQIVGEPLAAVARRFTPYQEAARDRFGAATIIENSACTGCMGEMVSTFIYLERAGLANRLKDLTVIFGALDSLPPVTGTPLVIGKCARPVRSHGVFVPGCPPHGIEIADGACRALGIDTSVVRRTIAELHSA